MDDGLKQRLIGAIVLVVLAVIFLPLLFNGGDQDPASIAVAIPPKPEAPKLDLKPPQEPVKPQARASDIAQQAEQTISDQVVVDEQQLPVSWSLQMASFKDKAKAQALRDKLRDQGYNSYINYAFGKEASAGDQFARVLIGPELDRKSIEDLRIKLNKALKLNGQVVRYLP